MTRSLVVTSLLVASALATPLAAQQSDTAGALPFRGGQWATQFGFDGNFLSAGALRFRSQHSAYVVDGFARTSRMRYENPNFVGSDRRTNTDVAIALQAGMRRYRPAAERVNAFGGAGLRGQAFVTRSSFVAEPTAFTQRNGAAGLYGEVGATWMVSRNLGLSGATQLGASYQWSTIEQSGTPDPERTEGSGYGVALERARLMVTVFF
jgi:hypothetical protein